MVLYRKYSPQTFAEVVGQEHVVDTLRGAIKSNAVAHGYLFTGSRGSGKTTLARLLAKAVNCTNLSKTSYDVCGKCDSCKEIEEGHSLDLIEIDAASNRGIDEIRAVRDSAQVSPFGNGWKVFIIDEIHMLTKEAFNALLKTLEEPPAKTLFVLATTEPQRVPATIMSRVQRFDFKKLTVAQIAGKLAMIAKAEKIKISPEAIRQVALMAEGALRDAESALGKLIDFCGSEIEDESLGEVLGVISLGVVGEFLSFLINCEGDRATLLVNRLHDSGVDLDHFGKNALEYCRYILAVRANPSSLANMAQNIGEAHAQQVATLAGQADSKLILRIITALLRAQQEMKISPIPQLPLEIAIMELTSG